MELLEYNDEDCPVNPLQVTFGNKNDFGEERIIKRWDVLHKGMRRRKRLKDTF